MRFVVLGSQRAGTVYIEELITSHPQAHCWGEILLGMDGPTAVGYPSILNRRRTLRHIWRHVGSGSATNPARVIGKALATPPLDAVGFRLMYNQANKRVLAAIKESGAGVVHVTRSNLIRQFVSLQQMRARQANLGAGSAHSRTRERFGAIRVDPDKAIAFAQSREADRERLASELGDRVILKISYEDDILGPGSARLGPRLTGALGIASTTLESSTQRTGSSDLSNAVLNYEQLRDAVRATPYSWMLS